MRLLLAALAALVLSSPAAARDREVNAVTVKIAERAIVQADADGDGVLTAKERSAASAEVVKRLGDRARDLWEKILDAADANDDGKVTRAEWSALAESVGVASGWIARRTVMVPMADGVRLATDVYLPEGEGPFPAILWRTPYGKGAGGSPKGWLDAGYAVVRQDMRGRFASEGENLPFIGCAKDGPRTVAWIRKQPWSDGRVGTEGGSALGITQNLMAGAAPEGLVCQHIVVAAASMYHHAVYVGGALRKSQVERWLAQQRFDPKAIALYRAHPAYDAFWKDLDSLPLAGATTAPAMHVGGWFDTFSQGTVDAFRARQEGGGPGAKGRQKLVMGPWAHGGFRGGGRVGELTFPNAATPEGYDARSWFDRWLMGKATGVDERPAVAYYVMGDTRGPKAPGNEWRFADAWPVPARATDWFLGTDGRLATDPPAAPAGDAKAFREYTFEPWDPCPTVGGCNLVLPAGPRDQSRVERRKDVLVYSTPALEAPVEITGHAEARVFVSSSARDTDLSVRLCDVYPDGRSYLMAEGMLRLRYREGFTEAKLLRPGEVTEVTVPLWPTSVVVNRGHRIRVTVTSSNHPRFDVNPGTGKPAGDGGKTVAQTNRIWCTRDRPSRIVLPVVAGK